MATTSVPISKTKIIVPNRRRELLSRPRLLENLKALLDNKLVLLSATAGYGKTSLLIDLAHTVEMPVCWLGLDALDRDPQRFMAYLIASLSERFPNVGGSSQNVLNNLKSIESDAESLLVTLTNELYEQVEDDFLLIVDDYHLLDDVPVISSLINRFLQLVDENCHILISSRTLPDLDDVTLMVAREQVAGLSHIELAFQPREIQALYAQNHLKHLSEERANELFDKTGGWITGMVLSSTPGMQVSSSANTFSYLGGQVLDQQPGYVREFLLRTSLPEEFNAEFCEIVLGPFYPTPQNWLALMGLIVEKNLFVLPLEDGRWLRYHPLFREFLQSRLKEEHPQDIQPMLERMVRAYEVAGEWEKAYFTCKQLNHPEALADLIERAGTPMLQTALITLEGWINSLPPAIIRTRAGLISLRGVIVAMKGNLQEGNQLLDLAISMYREDWEIKGLTLALVRRANTLRLLGRYADSTKDIEEAMRLAESDVSLQALYAEALRIKGLNLYRLGKSRDAIEDLDRSLSLYAALRESGSISLLLAETAMVRAAIGDVDVAKRSYQESLEILRSEKNIYSQADTLNNLAVLHLQLGEYERASETFEEGLIAARNSHNYRAESLILAGLGDLYTEIEEFDAAQQAYELADAIAAGFPGFFLVNYLLLARANLALLQYDHDSVSHYLKVFRKKLKTNPSGYERGLWALLEGRSHFLKGEYKKVIPLLKEAKISFMRDGRETEYQGCVVWLMTAYDKLDQRENVRNEFQELTTLRNKSNHSLILVLHQATAWLESVQNDPDIGRELGGLLEKSKQLGASMPSIRRVLRRLAQSIQMPSARLRIRAFGRAEVTVNGRALNISDWRTQSVRDLFFYFLYNQEPLSKEQIAHVLWPEIEEPQAIKARYKQEIYRLRRAVGRNAIVFDDEYYGFNRELDHEYDVEAFESYLRKAYQTRDAIECIGYYRKAVDLVEGLYLSDVDADWVLIERERLRRTYISALESLAQLYLDTNQLEGCLGVCKLAISQDRYNETIYQLEMRAYAAQGDRASVARRYREYKTVLAEDLGLAPSEETEQIYRELII